MALTKKSSVDETLEVVRDLEKFKKRISELGAAQAAADASLAKAKTEVNALRVKMDGMVADANKKVKEIGKSLQGREDAVAAAQADANDKLGKVARNMAALTKREDRLAQDRAALKRDVDELSDKRVVFSDRVGRFEAAAKAACNGV